MGLEKESENTYVTRFYHYNILRHTDQMAETSRNKTLGDESEFYFSPTLF